MDIFEEKEEEQKLLFKKYTSQIFADRIIIFCLIILSITTGLIDMAVRDNLKVIKDLNTLLPVKLIAVVLVFFVLSYVRPLVSFSLLTLLFFSGFIIDVGSTILDIFNRSEMPGGIYQIDFMVQVVMIVFMIRGTINTFKHERLKKVVVI